MELGCSPDIEVPLVKYNIGAGREFLECCTRYQQKIFALKTEQQRERNHYRLVARRNMAATGKISEEYIATTDNITRLPTGSISSSISFNEGEKHVHFGDEIVVQECPFDRLYWNG